MYVYKLCSCSVSISFLFDFLSGEGVEFGDGRKGRGGNKNERGRQVHVYEGERYLYIGS